MTDTLTSERTTELRAMTDTGLAASAEFAEWAARQEDAIDVLHLQNCSGCRNDVLPRFRRELDTAPLPTIYAAIGNDGTYGIVDDARPTTWARFGAIRPDSSGSGLVTELQRLREGRDNLFWSARPATVTRLDETTWLPFDAVPERAAATLEEVWARLGKEANERGWCSEYDELARQLGGPERPARMRSYTVYARVPVSVEIPEHADGSAAAVDAWVRGDRRAAQRTLAEKITELAAQGQYSAVPILSPEALGETI